MVDGHWRGPLEKYTGVLHMSWGVTPGCAPPLFYEKVDSEVLKPGRHH
jgi:hypothetical protein